MLRLLIVFYISGLSFIGLFDGDGVVIDFAVPDSVQAGQEFKVELKLNKGDLQGFSRFLQELPAGLTVRSDYSANADFSFEDKKMRLIWLKLPEDQLITISYYVMVDERLKGNFQVNGKFSYIVNNERKSVESFSKSMYIKPSPNIGSELMVDINEFEKTVIPNLLPTSSNAVACIREKPGILDPSLNGFVVNLLVYKTSQDKFAKIEESVPVGYKAVSIDPQASIFTFSNQTAKFLWMNMPPDPYFIVSYLLVPEKADFSAPQLSGIFSYIKEEQTYSYEIIEKDLALKSLNNDAVNRLLAEISGKQNAGNSQLADNSSNVNNSQEQKNETKTNNAVHQEIKNRDEVISQEVAQIVKGLDTENRKSFRRNIAGEYPRHYILEPQEGVYYRVQLAAGHKKINIKKYFKRLGIADEVRAEVHDGWHKYSVGSFKEYIEARDYRAQIWDNSKASDAFVSAYNSGKRITVQEALMISNQKWYK